MSFELFVIPPDAITTLMSPLPSYVITVQEFWTLIQTQCGQGFHEESVETTEKMLTTSAEDEEKESPQSKA